MNQLVIIFMCYTGTMKTCSALLLSFVCAAELRGVFLHHHESACHYICVLYRYYEDLQCKAVDGVIERRLAAGEPVTLPSGKLLERLLTFKMIRDNIDSRSNRVQGSSDKACFLPSLIKLAEPRLTSIRCVLHGI